MIQYFSGPFSFYQLEKLAFNGERIFFTVLAIFCRLNELIARPAASEHARRYLGEVGKVCKQSTLYLFRKKARYIYTAFLGIDKLGLLYKNLGLLFSFEACSSLCWVRLNRPILLQSDLIPTFGF